MIWNMVLIRPFYRSTRSWTKSFSQARFKRQASRLFSRDWSTWTSWNRSGAWFDWGSTLIDYEPVSNQQSFAWSSGVLGFGQCYAFHKGKWKSHTVHATTLGPMSKSRTNLVNAKPFVFSFHIHRPSGSGGSFVQNAFLTAEINAVDS
jgi:hypothetical protein